MNWVYDKPVFTDDCVVVVAHFGSSVPTYRVFQVKRVDNGDGSYMGLLDADGDEYDHLDNLTADAYCILSEPSKQ